VYCTSFTGGYCHQFLTCVNTLHLHSCTSPPRNDNWIHTMLVHTRYSPRHAMALGPSRAENARSGLKNVAHLLHLRLPWPARSTRFAPLVSLYSFRPTRFAPLVSLQSFCRAMPRATPILPHSRFQMALHRPEFKRARAVHRV
jgi:hypothetical protein